MMRACRFGWDALLVWRFAVVVLTIGSTALADGGSIAPVVLEAQTWMPLVPEGESETLLGVSWKGGRPTFRHAPRVAGAVTAVAWSPDGKTLASGSYDQTVRLWDADSGRELRRLQGHAYGVTSVVWSPDGTILASGSADSAVRLWDADSGRELRRLQGHSDGVTSVAWSPDRKMLASGSYDHTVRLWDADSGHELRRLQGHSERVTSVAWSPDGKTLASGGYDDTIRLWDAGSGRELHCLNRHSSMVYSVTWSPDGKIVASGGHDSTVRLWDAGSGRELRRLEGHPNAVTSVAWSPHGKSLASGADDHTVRLWDATSGRELYRIKDYGLSLTSVAWSPDGKTLASGSWDSTARLWDTTSGSELRRLQGYTVSVTSVAWSPDGKTLASGADDHAVRLWDAGSGREVLRLHGHSSRVTSVAWSPDGKTLASGSWDSTVRLWDATSRSELRRLQGHCSAVKFVVWSPSGETLALGCSSHAVWLWDPASGRELRRIEGVLLRANFLAWSPDGKTLASDNHDDTVGLWDVATGRELHRQLRHSNRVTSVAWSPDGRTLASGSLENTVRLWDAGSGRELRRFAGHSSIMAWSPDGKTLASDGSDNSVRLWDAGSGRELHRLDGHASTISSIAWSPDGKILASASADGSVRYWNNEVTGFRLAMVSWSGDGWLSWRATEPAEHRVLRGERGSLLRRPTGDGSLEAVVPSIGLSPRLAGQAEITRAAELGAMGEVAISVQNAANATAALWVELRTPSTSPGSTPAPFVFRSPPAALRIEPGDGVRFPIEYIRSVHDNPRPGSEKVVLALRHAHDGGTAIDVPVELPFRAPDIAMSTRSPVREGEGLSVPIALINDGNQATGRELSVTAQFVLLDGRSLSISPTDVGAGGRTDAEADAEPDRSAPTGRTRTSLIPSGFQTVLKDGLAPKASNEFSLKVPEEVARQGPFRVRLTVTEGIAAGMPAESTLVGMVSTWTLESSKLSAPVLWASYLGLALAVATLGAAAYFVRVYRDPVVVATAHDASSLIVRPLRALPRASRALARARRLDGVLGGLGIDHKRWEQLLDMVRAPEQAMVSFLQVLGAELGDSLENLPARRARLVDLRVRFGPEIAVAVLEGLRVVPGDAQQMTEVFRESGIAGALLLDLTDTENGRQVFGEVARFAGVVLSSDALRNVVLAGNPLRALERIIAEQRPVRELSPYRTSGGVEQTAMFVGRAEELRKLADRDLQNAVLVGARQMGKSSLLKAVARRLATRKGLEVRYHVLATDDLLAELADALGQARPNSVAGFQRLIRGTRACPRVWLIDEADQFAQTELAKPPPHRGAVARALRALAEEGNTYFILSGYWELFRAAVYAADSPIRNLGELIRLGPLDAAAARKLVCDPMLSLGIATQDAAVEAILEQTGRRANLVVLACHGLIEQLAPVQRTITLSDVEGVWSSHAPLRDALKYWREVPFDRAVGHAALALDRPTRRDIELRLRNAGIRLTASELDQAFERLELGHVLLREADPSGGPDRWICPIPLIRDFESRTKTWDEHLEIDAEEIDRGPTSHGPESLLS